jgi:hypothetical protein
MAILTSDDEKPKDLVQQSSLIQLFSIIRIELFDYVYTSGFKWRLFKEMIHDQNN